MGAPCPKTDHRKRSDTWLALARILLAPLPDDNADKEEAAGLQPAAVNEVRDETAQPSIES